MVEPRFSCPCAETLCNSSLSDLVDSDTAGSRSGSLEDLSLDGCRELEHAKSPLPSAADEPRLDPIPLSWNSVSDPSDSDGGSPSSGSPVSGNNYLKFIL
jgi:hypothetical protein